MSNINPNDRTIMDARLKALLETLRDTPPRDPQATARSRAKFLQEIDALFPDEEVARSQRFMDRSPKHPHQKESFIMNIKQRFALTALTLVIMAIAVLFGGAGVTAYAAQNALPGDALYAIKTRLEQTRIALTSDEALKSRLYLSFAERRLNEMALLIQEGKADQVGGVAKEFDLHIQRAIEAFGAASAGNPADAEALARQIAETLLRYAQTLNGILANAPEEIRPTIQQAIRTSTLATGIGFGEGEEIELVGIVEAITSDSITINGQIFAITNQSEIKNQIQVGATVKVHAVAGADGALRVREMEQVQIQEQHQEQEQHQAGENENGNGNANENANQNGNTNLNGNDNDDDSNENDDDNENGNTNLNGNDNDDDSNDNDDDNENGNTNLNGNDNDDDSNENGNTNLNGNDNDDDTNKNGNTNLNGNDNDDDSNENGNTNSNGNGNDNGNDHDDDHDGENENQNSNENGYIPILQWVV